MKLKECCLTCIYFYPKLEDYGWYDYEENWVEDKSLSLCEKGEAVHEDEMYEYKCEEYKQREDLVIKEKK